MSDGQAPEPPGKIKIFFRRCRTVIGVMSWIVPIIIMGVSYYAFPALRQTVTFDGSVPHDAAWGLLAVLAAVGGWLIYEFWYAVSRNTTVTQLQVDSVISTFFAILFTGIGMRWVTLGVLPFWFVLPWIATVLDALGSGVGAINNAAQKPIIQQDPR